jgi:Outer membrane protein
MIRNCTRFFLLFAFIALSFTRSHAQGKIAYVDMQQLVFSMPETKQAYDSLKLFERELARDGETLMKELQVKIAAFQKEEATLKPDMRDIKVQELQTAQNSLEQYRARAEQQLAAREQAMTAPIVAKGKKAVADLAAEKGYVCVLDSSKDIIVTATCDDILAQAKQQLGIK